MPREIVDSDFYIALLSNSAQSTYPNNTLSAFTNTMCRPVKLDGVWSVGLTEIGFNSFTHKTSALIMHHPYSSPSSSTDPVADISKSEEFSDRESIGERGASDESAVCDEIELSECGPSLPKKPRTIKKIKIVRDVGIGLGKIKDALHAHTDVAFILKIDDSTSIVFTNADLAGMAYSKKRDINFGKFLETMAKKIEPAPSTTADTIAVKTKIMDRMLACLRMRKWDEQSLRYQYKRNASKDWLLHVYMGSTNSSNIVLRHNISYNTVEEFIEDVVLQIPQRRRLNNKLIELFKIFYPEYAEPEPVSAPPKTTEEGETLEILFVEYDAKLTSDVNTLPKSDLGNVAVQDLINDLSENLKNYEGTSKYITQHNTELIDKIKTSVYDVFRDGIGGDGPSKAVDSKSFIKIDLTDKDGQIYQIDLPITTYKRVKDFISEIYNRLPAGEKNDTVFRRLVDKLFQNVTPPPAQLTAPAEATVLIPSGLDHLVPKDATGVVIAPTTPSEAGGPDVGVRRIFPVDKSVHVFKPVLAGPSSGAAADSTGSMKELLFVYADIIMPRRVGAESIRVLKIIPYDGSHCIRFPQPEYLPLQLYSFNTISVIISDTYGENINFTASNKPTYLMLHFKRIE